MNDISNITLKEKILIVHNYYQIPGGEDMVVENEKKLLEKYGHEVLLYSRDNSELKYFSKLQKLLLPITFIFNPKTYRDVKRIIRDNKVDIVHVHNTLSLISPSVYYAALSCKVPVVQTIHNFRLLCPGATFYRDDHICEDCVSKGLGCAIKHSCYRGSKLQTLACVVSTWIHRWIGIYKKINYICLTDFNKNKLLNLKGIKEFQVFVKPNFAFENTCSDVIETKHRDFYIYVGRLDELKGIKLLFEAWKHMEPLAPKLIVCGTGPLEDWCKNYVQNNPECNIELKGFVANIEVKKLMANAKALILPTQWYEGFPMTVLEAYSVGTPVLASDLGNTGCVVVEVTTGLKFLPNSPEEIADTVLRLNQYQNINQTTVELYRSTYSPENNYKKLIEIYRSVPKLEKEER